MRKYRREPLTFVNLALALANDYVQLYVIDPENDSYVEYSHKDDTDTIEQVAVGENFFEDVPHNAREQVYEEDLEQFLAAFRKEVITEALNGGRSFSITYRLVINGTPRYFFLKTIRATDRSIVIGVQDIDEQKRRELEAQAESRAYSEIAQSLASLFEVIYHVDISTNHYTEYSSSESYARLGLNNKGDDFFTRAKQDIDLVIHPDDRNRVIAQLERETMLDSLEKNGVLQITYRQILDNRIQYVELLAFFKQGDSDSIVIGVRNIDAQKRREQSMEKKTQTFIDMANRDALTAVKNKRAYAQAETELDKKISDNTIEDFAIVICDINGLKTINDTMGHNAGDEFIKNGCKDICDIFQHSPVFRIGGDEFAVIVAGSDYNMRDELMDRFSDIQTEHKTNGGVTIACGISDFDRKKDMCVQDVFERADAFMYNNKKMFKDNKI